MCYSVGKLQLVLGPVCGELCSVPDIPDIRDGEFPSRKPKLSVENNIRIFFGWAVWVFGSLWQEREMSESLLSVSVGLDGSRICIDPSDG